MSNKVYIVATCNKTTKDNLTSFHFTGYYQGQQITEIVVKHPSIMFYGGNSYVINLKNVEVNGQILTGELVKRKDLL